MKQVWVGVLAGAVLSGCASTPAPYMTEEGYNAFAVQWNTAEQCIAQGDIDPVIAAYGKKRMLQAIAGLRHDPTKLNNLISYGNTNYPVSPIKNCRKLESMFAGLRDEYDRNSRDTAGNKNQYTSCFSGALGTNCVSY